MGNVIKIKRGSGVPSSSNDVLEHYELGYRTGTTELYINDGGTYRQLGGGGLSSVNNSNWSGTDLAVANGGTGASSASGARSNLGLGTGATLNTAAVSNGATTLATGDQIYDHVTTRISGKADTSSLGELALLDDIPTSRVVSGTFGVARGGTGASTAAAARANLGLSTGNTSSFLTGDPSMSTSGYIMTRGIVNQNETGSSPAAITFGNGATYANDNISLITSGATALFINSSGNVAIGGTTANRDLQINGTGIIRLKDADGDPGLDFGDAEMQLRYRTASDKLQVYSYGTTSNVLTIQKSNGNVGIGTESPDAKLEITGSTNQDIFSLEGAGSSFKLIAESGDATSVDSMAYRLGLRYGSNDNGFIDFYRGPDGATGYLAFGASGSEAMRLDRYGRLGIGVTSPWSSTVLDLGATSNNMRTGSKIYFYDSNKYIGRNGDDIQYYNNHGNHRFYKSSTEIARIDGLRLNLYGTSASEGGELALHPGTDSSYTTIFFMDSFQNKLRVHSGGVERFYISTDGTIGLNGTVAGSAVLDEDDMASDSPSKLASQQSIKAYVDANAGGDSNTTSDGSAGTPAFNFTSDTNTGMFRVGSDTLGFSAGGNTKLQINSDGRINYNGWTGVDHITIRSNGHTNSGSASTFFIKFCTVVVDSSPANYNGVTLTGKLYRGDNGHGNWIDWSVWFNAALDSSQIAHGGFMRSNGAHWISNILVQRTGGDGEIDNGTCTYELYYDINENWTNNIYNVATEIHYPSEGKFNVTWNYDQSEVTSLPGTQVVSLQTSTYDDGNQTLVQSGAVGAPSYSFLASRNTGMYRVGADQLGFSTAGTRRGYFNSDGNFYLDKSLIVTTNAQGVLGRDTGGTVRNAIKIDSGNSVLIGDSNLTGQVHAYPATYLQVNTDNGYGQFGPQNSGWCHIQTDRDKFYFNKKIIVDQGIIAAYDEDLSLRRSYANTDDEIVIEASEIKFRTDAVERLKMGSAGITISRNANPDGDDKMAINLSGSYGGGIHFTDTKHSGIWNLANGTEMHFGVGGASYVSPGSDQGLFMMEDNGDFHADADVIAFSSSVGSDKKLKENIKDMPYGLLDVMKMRAVEFDWKEKRQGVHDIGVIAQEIEKIIPEVVRDVKSIGGSEGTHKVVDYGKLASVLIKAIQEQQQQINELKEKLNV